MADTITHDFENASAGALARAVAAKKVSASELTEAAIARIERLNPPLNAVVVKDYDRARAAAKAADERAWRGEKGALLGVPMTVKDSHNVAGLPTTWGFVENKDFLAKEDSACVARLKAAGAVILGKTNIPPALADWQSDNPVYGRTNNPFDVKRTPGGSSGGGAAAVAAGMVPIELGSDIGGSIRIPATFCGIFGHKSSWGLVPARGQTLPGMDGAPSDLGVIGPLTRKPEDLALVMSVIAGPDTDEAVGYQLALRPPRHTRLSGARVLIVDSHPLAALDGEIRGAIDRLATDMEKAGAKVSRSSPLLPDLAEAHNNYTRMLMTIMSRRTSGGGVTRPAISAHDWLDLVDIRYRLRRQWRTLFETFDVVIAPAFGTPPFEHNPEPDWGKRSLMINGEATPYGAQLAWPGIATFPGLPSTAAPIGKTAAGLPIGVQIIGAYLEDNTTMEFAQLLAQ